MRVLITADPYIPVPPVHYGGIERVIDVLVGELVRRGPDVPLVAHPGSPPPAPPGAVRRAAAHRLPDPDEGAHAGRKHSVARASRCGRGPQLRPARGAA